jgi:hypothetical protein
MILSVLELGDSGVVRAGATFSRPDVIPDKRVLDSLSAAPASRRAWTSQSGKNAKEG